MVAVCAPFLTACDEIEARRQYLHMKAADPDEWYKPSGVTYTDSFETKKAAADKGDPDGMYVLALDMFGHPELGSPAVREAYIVEAAKKKNYWAEVHLANAYRRSNSDLPLNYSKAIYWKKRLTCDYTFRDSGSHMFLATLYQGSEKGVDRKIIYDEEWSLVPRDPVYAYVHLYLAGFVGQSYAKSSWEALTEDQKTAARDLIHIFRNGGCPYGV